MKVAVIGSGVVGQATGKGFATLGHDVVFCDINRETVAQLKDQGYFACLPGELETVKGVAAYFLAISTPTVDERIKLDFLEAAVADLGTLLKKRDDYTVVCVRSTVPPGTTEKVVIPILERYSGKKAGCDFGVTMNPEYLRENRNEEDFRNPRLILIGQLDKKSGHVIEEVYSSYDCEIVRTPLKAAEMQKYVHNLYNATKITFFNEMRNVCRDLGIASETIFPLVALSAEASWNPEYGIRDFGPYSGSCLPKDTTAFASWAYEQHGRDMTLLTSVIRVNRRIAEHLRHQKEVG